MEINSSKCEMECPLSTYKETTAREELSESDADVSKHDQVAESNGVYISGALPLYLVLN